MFKTAIGTLLMFIGTYTVFSLTESVLYPFMTIILILLGASFIE